MTRQWLSLCRVLLASSLGTAVLRHRFRNRLKLGRLFLSALGLAVVLGTIMWLVGQITGVLLDGALTLGQPEFVLTFGHVMAGALVLLFGAAFVMSAFFLADDTSLLLSLPLRPSQIVSAKFAVTLVYTYITMAPMLLPVYAVYMMKIPVERTFIPRAAVTFLVTPLVPLAFASFIVLILVRLVGSAKRRDLFVAAGGLFVSLAAVGVQYMLHSRTLTGTEAAKFARLMLERTHGMSELLAQAYPPALWAMQTILGSGAAAGLLPLFFLLLSSAAMYGVVLIVGRYVYLHAWQRGQESAPRTTRRAVKSQPSNAVWAVARADRKLILRTPALLMYGLSGFVIVPLLLFASQGFADIFRNAAAQVAAHSTILGIFIVSAWFVVGPTFSSLQATGFSREGKHLWILQTLPISARRLFVAKLWSSMSIVLLPCTVGALITARLLQLTPGTTLIGIMVGLIWTLPVAMFSLAVDAKWPLLHWTDPNQLFRGNYRTLISGLPTQLGTVLFFIVGGRTGLWTMAPNIVIPWTIIAGLATAAFLSLIVAFKLHSWLSRAGE